MSKTFTPGQTFSFKIGRAYPVMTAVVTEVEVDGEFTSLAYELSAECAAAHPRAPRIGWVATEHVLETT